MNDLLREAYRKAKPKEALATQDQYKSADVLLGSEVEEFARLLSLEFIKVLEDEITLVKGYKDTSFNAFDVDWHQGKIDHFTKMIVKTKSRLGIE